MLGTLIKAQILENLFGIKFILTFLVCVILVIGVTFTGIARYENQVEADRNIVSINKTNLEEAEDWRDVGEDGIKVIKPATPLCVFSSGLDESVGRTATVHEWDFPHMEDSVYSTAPIFAVFGDLDMTFIIKIVISLFAILFTYDLICGEKERGTLKLALSNSVPRNTYLLGKSIGSFVSLLLALIVPLIFALLIQLTFGGLSYNGEEWARIALILLGYVFYLLSFFSIGLFVSSLTKNSAISFVTLLFIWVFFVLIVPKGAMMLASQITPVDTGINAVKDQQMHLQRDFRETVWQKMRDEMRKLPRPTSNDHTAWRKQMMTLRTTINDELKPDFQNENEKIVADFKKKQGNLTVLAMAISRISPASAVTYIGMNMSNTGYSAQEYFLKQLTTYRDTFADKINLEQEKEMKANAGRGRWGAATNEEGTIDITQVPTFKNNWMTLGESIENSLLDYLMMIIISIIFYALGFVLFLRYDVR